LLAGIIEKSAIEGQKQYHDDLESGIRTYIQDHPDEFKGHEIATSSTTTVQTSQEGTTSTTFIAGEGVATQSEAEKYAAKHKAKTAGVWGYITRMIDILDFGYNKETLLGALVVVLLISNLWTWFSPRNKTTAQGKSRGRYERELERNRDIRGGDDEEMANALRTLMRGRLEDPGAEARELMRILDGVEERAGRLRGLVKSAGVDVVEKESVQELD